MMLRRVTGAASRVRTRFYRYTPTCISNGIAAVESGVDEGVTSKFPGVKVTTGSAASGAGDNREIPFDEGGDFQKGTGRLTKARDFEGEGGPETKRDIYAQEQPGSDDVRDNVR